MVVNASTNVPNIGQQIWQVYRENTGERSIYSLLQQSVVFPSTNISLYQSPGNHTQLILIKLLHFMNICVIYDKHELMKVISVTTVNLTEIEKRWNHDNYERSKNGFSQDSVSESMAENEPSFPGGKAALLPSCEYFRLVHNFCIMPQHSEWF